MRRRRFLQRDRLAEDEWFELFRIPSEKRAAVRELMQELGKIIDVPWTVFRPTDNFTVDLRVRLRSGTFNDLEEFEHIIRFWRKQHLPGIPPPDCYPDQLGAFLSELSSA